MTRLRSQFVWILGGRIVAAALQAGLMLFLARAVSPAEFGFFAAPYGLATIIQTAFDLGLPSLAVKLRSRNTRDGRVTNLLLLNSQLSALMAFSMLILTGALAMWVNSGYLLLLPLAIWAAAERNADAWLGVALADGDVWVNMCNLVARRLLGLLAFVGLNAVSTIPPLLAFSIAVALAAVGSNVFAKRFVSRRLPGRAQLGMVSALRQAWPFWVNSVATQARNADTAITAILSGATQAGLYGAASRLTGPLRLFATSLASLLLPAASRSSGAALTRLVRAIVSVIVLSSVGYGLLALVVPVFLPVVLGRSYTGAVLSIQIILIGLIFASATALLEAVLQGINSERFVAVVSTTTSVLALVGVAIGAQSNGASGAAAGLSAAFAVQAIALITGLLIIMRRFDARPSEKGSVV